MVFNSLPFVLFFVVVFTLYWSAPGRAKLQNWVLLLASYFFYGYASWKMLPLLLVSTIAFYAIGRGIYRTENEKTSSRMTSLGVVLGIGLLVYFKYLNFFIDEFSRMLAGFGLENNIHSFGIIMPLGISFFTFRLISYVLDIHHGKYKPTEDFVTFASYVAFFPCILSGPIDRPKFMGQLTAARIFDYDTAVDGCRQILWGLFKKVVIADNCATYVDTVWGDVSAQSGSTLVLAAVLYSFQLYADFSGYSDMAIGIGKLLNLKVAKNFNYPFFALNMADFWRRWHMSLTSWLTDYVFMPLNIRFRDWGQWGMILAIVINMFLVGIWHGANWTYAVFGLYHGLLFIPLILTGAFQKKAKIHTYEKVDVPVLADCIKMFLTFVLVCIGQLIFRANSVGELGLYLAGICKANIISMPYLHYRYIPAFIALIIMLFVEWKSRKQDHALMIQSLNVSVRWIIYITLLVTTFSFSGIPVSYIYFQF